MTDISDKNEISMFIHCGKCLPDKPENVSPMEWAKTQVGFTPLGVQVWCNRCDCNVMHVDFEGAKHPANCTRRREIDDGNGTAQ
jgi:hypothetical protein